MFSPEFLSFSPHLKLYLDAFRPDFSSKLFITNLKQLTRTAFQLTFLHAKWIRNLNALACLPQNVYLYIGNGRKGSISRMSDECLMKQELGFPFLRCISGCYAEVYISSLSYFFQLSGGKFQSTPHSLLHISSTLSIQELNNGHLLLMIDNPISSASNDP